MAKRVYFNPQNVQALNAPPATTLTAFLELCQNDAFAKTLLYCDAPQYYTWNASRKKFERRKQGQVVEGHPGVKSCDVLGRVYTVHPSNAECFYLRMLLHVVRGPTSFTELKTVDGEVCQSYRETCERRGLLENDIHWDSTLEEASSTRSPQRIRHLFAILLTACALSNPVRIWEKYKLAMSEDILHQLRTLNPQLNVNFCPQIYDKALILLDDFCLSMTGKSLRHYDMPAPRRDMDPNQLCSEMLRETNYDLTKLTEYVAKNEPLLLQDQKTVYITILDLVRARKGGIIFLDAPGGTGKTFVINLILSKVRQQMHVALAVASSGIASTLLAGGRTAHSTFKLPLNLAHGDRPVCDIAKGTGRAKVIEQCSIIIWDECTMAHKRALEALHCTLQDIRSNNSLMGGVVVVLAGDFRQILPVIPRSTMADELNACL
jgi:hypothetical protein